MDYRYRLHQYISFIEKKSKNMSMEAWNHLIRFSDFLDKNQGENEKLSPINTGRLSNLGYWLISLGQYFIEK